MNNPLTRAQITSLSKKEFLADNDTINLYDWLQQALGILGVDTPSASPVSVGGSNTQIQYNNAGVFAGSSALTFAAGKLTTTADATINTVVIGKGAGNIASNMIIGQGNFSGNTTGTGNVIPGQLEVDFNFRYNTATNAAELQQRVKAILEQQGLNYSLDWQHSGLPFLTAQGELLNACRQAILETTGLRAKLSTSGGTSDGRFIAPTGCEVIEFGLINNTIHQVNECIAVEDLNTLTIIYLRLLEELFGN